MAGESGSKKASENRKEEELPSHSQWTRFQGPHIPPHVLVM